jgi:hypothetical protein
VESFSGKLPQCGKDAPTLAIEFFVFFDEVLQLIRIGNINVQLGGSVAPADDGLVEVHNPAGQEYNKQRQEHNYQFARLDGNTERLKYFWE